MGTPDNGDGWPDGAGAPDELPEIPSDWGPVVIPDDAAELAIEADQVRRELRRARHRNIRHQRVGIPSTAGSGRQEIPALRIPLIIMLVAVLLAVVSLFTAAWSDPSGPERTATTPGGTNPTGRILPALEVIDSDGATVPLHGLLPAVIMLVEDCDCANQVAAAATLAPAGVTVVTLTSGATMPSPPPAPLGATAPAIRALADPAGGLYDFLGVDRTAGTATVLLVAESGQLVRLVARATSVEAYRADLALLAGS